MRIDPADLLRERGLRVTAQRLAADRSSAPCLTAVDDIGYQIDEAEVIYWGRCPECATSVLSDG